MLWLCDRRKKREEKGTKDQKETKKRKAATPAKKPAAKQPAKKVKEDESEPDTTGDAELAAQLANKRESGRNRDATGAKGKKAKALAELREVSLQLMVPSQLLSMCMMQLTAVLCHVIATEENCQGRWKWFRLWW